MQYTSNYSLKKPQYADEADIEIINDNTDAVDSLIHQNRTMIAPAFDNTKAYVTGDPVEYLGALYVFTADKAAGAWDASKVEPTTAAEMGGGGASALADLDDVEITSPTDGQALLFDDSDDKWKNQTLQRVLTKAEYDALPSSKLTDGVDYYLKDVNGDGQDFHPTIYSTDEREIGVWTDGKPLYQKTIDMGEVLSINANSWGVSNISGVTLNIDKIINVPLVHDASYNFYGYLGGSVENDAEKHISFLNPRGSVTLIRYVTLVYTKTTDSPGSGTWTPQGVPAHHYSTDEQVVGTWIDGSTLYEKTIKKQNISSVSTSTVLISSSELTGMNIIEISGSYISTTTASTYPINAYINSNSMITTWLAEGDIYYWLYWGAADTYDAYITIRYTKS